MEQQEISKGEATVHSMRAWQIETMACQEMTRGQCRGGGAKSGGNGIRSGSSRGPYGKCRRETGQRMEEAAQGPASSCRATQRAKRTDPKGLGIPGEIGCRLQEGVPPCSSGMVEEEPSQGICGPHGARVNSSEKI
jgi:hypothetical protein